MSFIPESKVNCTPRFLQMLILWLPDEMPRRQRFSRLLKLRLKISRSEECAHRALTSELSGRTPTALPRETRPTMIHGPLQRLVRHLPSH